MNEKKFIVIDERKDGNGDIFQKFFDSLEDANLAARSQWDYLTYREQKKRHIYVAYTERTSAFYDPEDLSDPDSFDWEGYHSCDTPAGAFDSADL